MKTRIEMKPQQCRRARRLIKSECCNYHEGECLMEERPCKQIASQTLKCRWFRESVLPMDGALQAEMEAISPTAYKLGANAKPCAVCGQAFEPMSNRAKYCKECAARIHREQKQEHERKRREQARHTA